VCDPGFTGTGASCAGCTAGTYKDVPGNVGCSACPANSDSPGTSDRVQDCTCIAGYTGPNGGPCSACAPGSFKDVSGDAACGLCPAGTYSDQSAVQACTECAEHAVSGSGQTECQCEAGYSGAGAACVFCERGKYKSSVGSDECTDCPAGTYSTSQAASDLSACVDCPGW